MVVNFVRKHWAQPGVTVTESKFLRDARLGVDREVDIGNGPGGTINHLGVEVSSIGEVGQAEARLAADGLATKPKPGAVCCYALQDKSPPWRPHMSSRCWPRQQGPPARYCCCRSRSACWARPAGQTRRAARVIPAPVLITLAATVSGADGIYGIGGGSILAPILIGTGRPHAQVASADLASTFVTSVAGVVTFTNGTSRPDDVQYSDHCSPSPGCERTRAT
jgi:hypothetical protein